MQRKSTRDIERFREEITAHFSRLSLECSGITLWDSPAWRELVSSQGWMCPSWPVSWGGPGWSHEEKFAWYNACYAAFEDYVEPPEIADVGPALGRFGNQLAQPVLADIANLKLRCSLALFEDSFSVTDVQTELAGGRLTGWKSEVRFVERAEFLLVVVKVASGFALAIVPVSAPGVSVQVTPGLSGVGEFARVEFEGVVVAAEQIVGSLKGADELRALCQQTVGLELGRSGALDRQVRALRAPDDHDNDAGFNERLAELEISLQALTALEMRVVAAKEKGHSPPVPWSLLQARSLGLQLELGEVLVDRFGYYALPYPDSLSLHNEGPIGPVESRRATQAMLRATEQVNYANVAGDLYDIAVESLLDDENIDPASSKQVESKKKLNA